MRNCYPECKCGSRDTAQMGDSGLMRQCRSCGFTYSYRLIHGRMIPFAITTALALDEAALPELEVR